MVKGRLRAIALILVGLVVAGAVVIQPVVAAAAGGGVGYVYDENGRLLAVSDPNSDTAVYSYDAVGNVLSIGRHPTSALSLIHFSPASGAPGAAVTISGTGFNPSPAGDTVTFNGTAATVTSASATQLVAQVPTGATSGTIGVSTGGAPVSSGASFTVLASPRAPTITGISPTVATPGSVVTISGTNFQTQDATTNRVAFNRMQTFVPAPTGTSLPATLPAMATSGPVTVVTPFGRATGPDLIVPPPPHTAADILSSARIAIGAAPQSVPMGTAGKIALLLFDGAQRQRVSLKLGWSGSGSSQFNLYSPAGILLFSNLPGFVDPVTLPQEGTYTLMVAPQSGATGTASVEVWNVPDDLQPALTLGGSPVSATTTVRGQNVVYTFSGTAGQRVSLQLGSSQTTGSGSISYTVRNPDGTQLFGSCCNNPGARIFVDPQSLSQTGTYRIVVDPSGDVVGTATAEAWTVPADATTPLTLGAGPLTLANTVRGQNAVYTFSGTSGQRVSMQLTFAQTSGSGSITYSVKNPDGTQLFSSCCNNPGGKVFVDPQSLTQTGTYRIVVDPSNDSVGTATVEAWTVPTDATTTLTLGGGPLNLANTVRGQNAVYTFSGTSGQRVSMQLTFAQTSGSGFITYSIKNPDGTQLFSTCCNNPGARIFVDPQSLNQTGTYKLVVDPSNDSVGTATAEAWTVPPDATAPLTIGGGAVQLPNTVRGQNIVYTLSGTSGQRVSLQLSFAQSSGSGSISYSVKNPDGTNLFSRCCNNPPANVSTGTLTLSQTGTFKVVVDPSADVIGTATAQGSLVTSRLAAQAIPAPSDTPEAGPSASPRQRQKAGPPAAPAAGPASAEWRPGASRDVPDDFRTHRTDGPAQSIPALQAPPGVTAVAGQALRLDGSALPGVTFQIGQVSVRSDDTGRFLLAGVAGGRDVLVIDGSSANSGDTTYGTFQVGLNVAAGQTTILPFPVWMTRLDTEHAITIDSPTRSEVVLTNPGIPGLEVHLPRGTVVTDRSGKPVTRLSLTPIPVDRTPFPLPIAVDVPVYFTIQPGGAYLSKGARIVYPNFTHLRPGTRVSFWDYDPRSKGWYVYGNGAVTPDGRQVVPDPGVVLWTFSGAMFDGSFFTKWLAGWLRDTLGIDADPVDLGTGYFAYQKTDLTLPDTLPLVLTRTHIQNDTVSRPFGIGMTYSLDINLFSENQYQEVDLYVPGNAKIHYVRTSPGTGFTDAVFQAGASSDQFSRSTITWNGNGWDLTLRDGEVLVFGNVAPLQSIRDRNGNQITLIRSSGQLGNIVEAVSSNGRWIKLSYDTSNRITSAQDNLGRTLTYDYDTAGRLFHVFDPQGGRTTYTYDAANNIRTVEDATRTTFLTNEYDANERVHKQTFADGSFYQFAYTLDGGGRVTETDVTDPRGFVRRATFDAAGELMTDTMAAGTTEQVSVTLTRDTSEFVRSVTDQTNRQATLDYDAAGNLTTVTRMAGTPEAQTMALTYDPTYAQVRTVTDALHHTTTLVYDTHGNLTQVIDPLTHHTDVAPRGDGRPQTVTDPLHHTTTFTYDGPDLSAVTDPLGRTSTVFTDGAGRAMAQVDPLGGRTVAKYDPMNEVTSVVDPTGATTLFTYDPNGNLKTVLDANQHQTSYSYDNMDRLRIRTDPLQRAIHYDYDAAGDLVTLTDQRNQRTVLTYDGLGRGTFAGFNAITTGGTTTYDSTIGYSYDAAGRPFKVTDSLAGVVQYGYDDYDRVTQVTSPQGAVGYGYDAADRLTSRTIGSSTLVYGYDDANRLSTISQAGTTLVGKTYDDADRLASLTLPDGIVETPAYDDASQLTGITYARMGTTLGTVTYGYDGNGRRTSVDGSWARTGLPQPVSGASYDAANQLTTWNGTTITYDANGRLTSDGVNTYTWDARGQLSSVTGPSTTASFSYDGLGRRTQTIFNGSPKQYLYDGANVAQELTGGTPSATILGGGVDEYFSRTDGAGTRSFLTDALGSTVAMADAGGTVQTSYTYEPYGKATSAGAADANPLQFTGRENDGTGLQYNRARYYSPALQRFISQDPLGFGGGDVNTSAYAGDSPTNFTDPSGEFAFLIPMLVGCAIGGAGSALGDLAGAKLTGRKLAVGDLLRDTAMGCAAGALGGFLGELGGIVLGRLLAAGVDEASQVILDTNAVFRFRQAQALLNPGETGVMTRTGAAELRNVVARQDGLFMPRAAGGLDIIEDAGGIDTRINIRGALQARRPSAPGLFGDGSIGATVLATKLPFITADRELARALVEMGANDVRLLK